MSAAQKYNRQKLHIIGQVLASTQVLVLEIYAVEELEGLMMMIKVMDFVSYNKLDKIKCWIYEAQFKLNRQKSKALL